MQQNSVLVKNVFDQLNDDVDTSFVNDEINGVVDADPLNLPITETTLVGNSTSLNAGLEFMLHEDA